MVIAVAFSIAVAVLEYVGVFRDLARLGDDLGELRNAISRGFGEMNRGLAEVAALLRERLPRP